MMILKGFYDLRFQFLKVRLGSRDRTSKRIVEQYKDKIPTQKNKITAKLAASVLFIIILSLILRYVNGYTTFAEGFGYGFLLWTIVNAYDAIVLDICWFCHGPRFVFEGTEDMVEQITMEVFDFSYDLSVSEYYVTHRECGVCKIGQQENLQFLIPYMCVMDYPTIEYKGGKLLT